MPILAGLLLLAVLCAAVLAWQHSRKRGRDAAFGAIEPARDAPGPRTQFRPFKPIYHITMALKNAAPSEWITVDTDFASRLAARARILSSQGSGVHGVVPGGEAPALDLYRTLYTYLPQRYPEIFSIKANHLHNRLTGARFPLSVTDPAQALRNICTTVEEDFFVLTQEGGAHRCVAFVCCFPSGFDPADKLGKGLGAIHAPVPAYEKIGRSMERFFARLEVGKPVSRLNWSVQTSGELLNLAAKAGPGDEGTDPATVDISQAHLRVEHQTLTRLPATRALVFSFKTYLYPVAQIRAEGRGPEFADAIEGLQRGNAPGTWAYKGAARWGPACVAFLRS